MLLVKTDSFATNLGTVIKKSNSEESQTQEKRSYALPSHPVRISRTQVFSTSLQSRERLKSNEYAQLHSLAFARILTMCSTKVYNEK